MFLMELSASPTIQLFWEVQALPHLHASGPEANQQKYPVLHLCTAQTNRPVWSTVGRAGLFSTIYSGSGSGPDDRRDAKRTCRSTPPNVAWGVPTSGPLPLRGELWTLQRVRDRDNPIRRQSHRTIADRPHRAIAGLSMGGTQTLNLAFADLERFSAVGVFSSGILVGSVPDWEQDHLSVLDKPTLKNGLKMIWFKTGSKIPLSARKQRSRC
jgi:enterochelin esterase family protein